MATSNRDVSLTVKANTQGEEAIKSLAAQVRSLGKEGKDAAPEFERLATELDQLAGQSRAVETLKKLTVEVNASAAAQRNALAIASAIGAEYAEQAGKVDELRAAQARANEQYVQAKAKLDDWRSALRLAKLGNEDATKSVLSFAASNTDAQVAIEKLAIEVRQYKADLGAAKTAASEAATVEKALGKEHEATAKNVAASVAATREHTSALKAAEQAAAAAGVDIKNLAAEEGRLSGAFLELHRSAETARVELVKLAEATEQAEEATRLAEKATQALANIRKAAYQQDVAAKVRDEAEAQREVAQATAQAEKATQALANIRKIAHQQDVAAKVKEEAEAQKALTAAQAQGERITAALANIRKIAYQQDVAAKVRDEAAAMKELAAAAQAAAQALPNAFNAAGVRSVAAIQAEITQTTQAVRLLEGQFARGAITAYDLSRATGAAEARMQALRVEMQQLPASIGVLERMNTSVLSLVNRFGALTAAIATVGFAVKPVLDANLAFDSMQRVLTQVFGSAAEAAKQIDFVRRVSESAGLDVLKAGDAYTKFAVSARSSGIETALVQKVFEATANAAGNLGLSSDKTTHILDALGQMANKGVVSMEELRQQLGDSLPGALSLLAKGLGITEPQLVKLVESGKLLTSQALGPLAEAMATLAAPGGRVESLQAAMSRLGNQFTLAYQKIADTSFYRGLTNVVSGLANNFDTLTTGVKLLTEAFLVSKVATYVGNMVSLRTAVVATTAATEAAAAVELSKAAATNVHTGAVVRNTAALGENALASATLGRAAPALAAAMAPVVAGAAALSTQAGAAAANVGLLARAKGLAGAAASRLVGALGGPIGALITFALVAKDLGEAIGSTSARWLGFARDTEPARKALEEAAAVAKRAAEAQKELGNSWVKNTVTYEEALPRMEQALQASEKLAKAKELEGQAAVENARLTGNETLALKAGLDAARASAAAQAEVAAGKLRIAVATETLVAAYERQGVAQGKLSEAEKKALDDLKAKASVQRAAAEEAAQAASKLLAAAAASELAAAAAKNNAGRVRELEVAYKDAQESVNRMARAERAGVATRAQVEAASVRAAAAQGLYRDALKDAAAAGVDFRQVQTGVSDAFFKGIEGLHGVISSLREYRTEAQVASPVLTKAFEQHLAAAKTRQEVEYLTAEIERAREAGLLFGTDFEAAMLQAKKATEALNPALQQAQRDATALGVTLKDKIGGGADAGVADGLRAYERLKAGGFATEKEVGQAFVNLATKAIEANQGIVPEWVKVEASIRQATIAIDDQGKATVTIADTMLKNTRQVAGGFGEVKDAANAATVAIARTASVLAQTRYDAEKYALGPDGSRFTASGAGGALGQGTTGRILTTGVSPAVVEAQRQAAQLAEAAAADADPQYAAMMAALGRAKLPTGGYGPPGSAPGATKGPAATYTVKLELGQRSTDVGTASAADAQALVDFLRELETQASRGGG